MALMNKLSAAILATTILASTMLLGRASARESAEAEQASVAERNRAAIAAGLQVWADGTGSPYDLLAEEARWTITGNSRAARTYPTKQALIDEVIRPFNARMRERLVPTVHRLYAEDDTVIAHFDASGWRWMTGPTSTPMPGSCGCRTGGSSRRMHSSTPSRSTISGHGSRQLPNDSAR